jgi:uncharacterized protein YigE (DUF2233 family)
VLWIGAAVLVMVAADVAWLTWIALPHGPRWLHGSRVLVQWLHAVPSSLDVLAVAVALFVSLVAVASWSGLSARARVLLVCGVGLLAASGFVLWHGAVDYFASIRNWAEVPPLVRHDTIAALGVVFTGRAQLALWCFCAAACALLSAGVISRPGVGAERELSRTTGAAPRAATDVASRDAAVRITGWRTTGLLAAFSAAASAFLWHAGSSFAWENAHPIARGHSFTRGAVPTRALSGAGPHEAWTEAPHAELGTEARIDGTPAATLGEMVNVLRASRDLWTQLNPGKPFPGRLSVFASDVASVSEFARYAEAFLRAGYSTLQVRFARQWVVERPLLGPLVERHDTVLNATVVRFSGECQNTDAAIPMAPHFRAPLLGWLGEAIPRVRDHSPACFVLPPISCALDTGDCHGPLARGWKVAEQRRVGKGVEGLLFERSEQRYWAFYVAPEGTLAVFAATEDSHAAKSFQELEERMKERGERMVLAMNGGMYHADRSAVGLLVSRGEVLSPLEVGRGEGNFFLMPNGVFFLGRDGPAVLTTAEFRALEQDPFDVRELWHATQSGPMLLEAGKVHPRFDPESTSRVIRNGVCVVAAPSGTTEQLAVLALSLTRVSLFEFATFFRELGCGNALYLDGTVSALYAPALGRRDSGVGLGPVIAISEPLATGASR